MKSISSKTKVLTLLEARHGEFVSGADMATELDLSRNSIWKAVKALEREGYSIEGVAGMGYRLAPNCSILSAASIGRYLKSSEVTLEYLESTDSTNLQMKLAAEAGAAEGYVLVAGEQTQGRGRRGRHFSSPAGSGIYLSLLLRPQLPLAEVTLLTGSIACACARAVDKVFDTDCSIKWVNDLFVNEHKVGGILTEASFDAESGGVAYVVVGIGINLLAPQDVDTGIAGGILSESDSFDLNDVRARLAAAIIDEVSSVYSPTSLDDFIEEYRRRSFLTAKTVHIERPSGSVEAKVLGIEDNMGLRVEVGGVEEVLEHGEVSIPSQQFSN